MFLHTLPAPAEVDATTRPGAVLSAAVDVGAMLHQVTHDAQPAAGAGLMQGAVPGVVAMVHVTDLPLQTVQHHFLDTRKHTDRQSVQYMSARFLQMSSKTACNDHVTRLSQILPPKLNFTEFLFT